MNLRRRIFLNSVVSIAVMGTIAMIAWILMHEMRESVLTVTEEYGELQEIDEARSELEDARLALTESPPRVQAAMVSLEKAREVLGGFVASQETHTGAKESHHDEEAAVGEHIDSEIDVVLAMLKDSDRDPSVIKPEWLNQIDTLRSEVLTLSAGANQLVERALDESQRQSVFANVALLSLCVTGGVFVLILALLQHRWILKPLISLRDRVRHMAVLRGQSDASLGTVDPVGDLGRGFDDMFQELNGFYDTLESRVQQKSRELVLSERLASVGYLAAGVAHEINNPLNTILGYTELTLRDLERKPDDNKSPVTSLAIVREETLRCKHIVEKLLSLVRNSDAPRETVLIPKLIDDVVGIVEGLKQFRGRTIKVNIKPNQKPLCVMAREAEMKQVLLNLIINALEATPCEGGLVSIDACKDGTSNQIVIEVQDNGQGMNDSTASRVFEPFFSSKRSTGQSGTGLGLSIVHAIIQDHGGEITVSSEGLGRGSRFVIRLAAVTAESKEVAEHG